MTIRTAFITASAVLLAMPAWAEEAVHEAGEKHGSPNGSPVPQFNPESFAGQLFWLAITFTILYVVMAKFVLPRIGRVVESRTHHIAADLQAAQSQRDATQAALSAYEAKFAAARADAQSVIGQAQQSASQTQTIALSAQGNKIAGDIQAAEERIAAAKQQALASIAPAAAQAASAMIAKVAGVTPDQAKIDAAVKQALENKLQSKVA